MRPVKRIDPLLDANGRVKTFTSYQSARENLIVNLGGFCSYCEMRLDSSLHVEHVQPKSLHGGLALSWENFLLGCANCNSIKGDDDPGVLACTWPDKDNTALAFTYSEGGIVEVNTGLSPAQVTIATETMKLVGLDRKVNTAKASDRRWLSRKDAWGIATRSKERLSRSFNNIDMREQIVETCVAGGYWSVWMTVFEGDADMKLRFINAMPGTATDCFDMHVATVARPGGQI